jgi:hypothetical protein
LVSVVTFKEPDTTSTASPPIVSFATLPSSALWAGIRAPVDSPHADHGVLHGAFPHRGRRGKCAVWTSAPSLWVHVAHALGFEVVSLRSPQRDFGTVLRHFFPGLVLSSTGERSAAALHLHSVGIVFSDFGVVSSRQPGYWASNPVPHVFTCTRADLLRVPEGWSVRQKEFCHAGLGGATTGVYCLSVMAPDDRFVASNEALPPVPRQPWTPIASVINDVEPAAPLSAELESRYRSTPRVLKDDAPILRLGRFLDARGLASPDVASARVIVGCVFNSGGMGLRRLKDYELGALADVPILLLDHLRKECGVAGAKLIRGLAQGHPGKVLFMGSDYLLTAFVRGGYDRSLQGNFGVKPPVKSAQELTFFSFIGNSEQGSFGVKPPVKSAQELTPFSFIRNSEHLAVMHDEDEGEIQREVQVMGEVRSKEGQKEDDSPIHFHIWDVMFLRSWADGLCGGNMFSLDDSWVDPRGFVTIPACSDARDCLLSDTQLSLSVQLPRWRWSLFKIRSAALRFWRRNTTRSFNKFIRASLPSSKEPEWLPPLAPPRRADTLSRIDTCVSRGRVLRKRKGGQSLEREIVYEWKGHEAGLRSDVSEGKQQYQSFWKKRRLHCPEVARSLEVGRDCISRTANALWWDWAAGSALLFWNPCIHCGSGSVVIKLLPRSLCIRTPSPMVCCVMSIRYDNIAG